MHVFAPTVGASMSTIMEATMAMPILTEMGVTAPTTVLTTDAPMTQPEMRTFVPPFTVGVPMSTSTYKLQINCFERVQIMT